MVISSIFHRQLCGMCQVEALLLTLESASNNLELVLAPALTTFADRKMLGKRAALGLRTWCSTCILNFGSKAFCQFSSSFPLQKNIWRHTTDSNGAKSIPDALTLVLLLNFNESLKAMSPCLQVLHLVPDTLRESISNAKFVQLPKPKYWQVAKHKKLKWKWMKQKRGIKEKPWIHFVPIELNAECFELIGCLPSSSCAVATKRCENEFRALDKEQRGQGPYDTEPFIVWVQEVNRILTGVFFCAAFCLRWTHIRRLVGCDCWSLKHQIRWTFPYSVCPLESSERATFPRIHDR